MPLVDALSAWLTGLLGPFGPLMAVGMLGVALILVALPALLRREADPLDRLRAQVRDAAQGRGQGQGAGGLRQPTGKDKLERYSTFLEPQDEKELSAVRLKLLQAGYRSKTAVRIYHLAQMVLGLGLLVLGVAYTLTSAAASGAQASTQTLILQTLVPGAVGYLAPKYWVTRRQATRKENITNGFPDSLDMMLVCVEAGQSLDQSILRVSKELRAGFPDLADEYQMVNHEMKAGRDKTEVLRAMSTRCGVPDVSSFVTVLIQSQQFGTSIADALRIYAGEMRDKRVMRAEEKANTLPTKMTLATMMLTVPPLLIILIGPSIYDIYVTLGGGAQEATGLDD